MSEDLYYITSPHGPNGMAIVGNCVQFWRVAGMGYTCDLNQAWKVPLTKAQEICGMKRGDRAYPTDIIDALSVRHLDFQFLRDVEQQFGPKHDSPIRTEEEL